MKLRYFISKTFRFSIKHAVATVALLAILTVSIAYNARAGVTITSRSIFSYDNFITYVLGLTADSTGTVVFPDTINGYLDNIIVVPGSTSPSANTTVKLLDPYATSLDWIGDVATLATTTGPLRTKPYVNSQYEAILVSGQPTISIGSNTKADATLTLIVRTIQKKK